MITDIFDKLFKLFKPIEDLTYQYYENDYMFFVIIAGVIIFFLFLGFIIFKIVFAILS